MVNITAGVNVWQHCRLYGQFMVLLHELDAFLRFQNTVRYARTNEEVGGQVKRGDFSTCDAPRPGGPKTVTTPEIIDQIHELMFEDRWISAKSIAEQLGISRERFGLVINHELILNFKLGHS